MKSHLSFSKHFRNNWGLGQGKCLLIVHQEKRRGGGLLTPALTLIISQRTQQAISLLRFQWLFRLLNQFFQQCQLLKRILQIGWPCSSRLQTQKRTRSCGLTMAGWNGSGRVKPWCTSCPQMHITKEGNCQSHLIPFMEEWNRTARNWRRAWRRRGSHCHSRCHNFLNGPGADVTHDFLNGPGGANITHGNWGNRTERRAAA
jgi:hypothetical protein